MSTLTYFLFWSSLFFIAYTYLVYPAIILVLSVVIRNKPKKERIEPSVSFLIVAYNEEKVIDEKLKNCLAIDYPKEKIEFVIVSSGSTDNTEKIVNSYKEENVRLEVLNVNRGKSYAINKTIPKLNGEIIVFSDSRQIYETNSVRELVANFKDPAIGGVSGQLMLSSGGNDKDSMKGISFYWNYEKIIRRSESDVYSTVGTTGAIYAIRRELFEPIPNDTILDDFVIPMNIVRKGYRVVFETNAIAWDTVSETWSKELNRKVRTIAGNFQVMFRMHHLFNYKKNRIFFQFISHKVLRLTAPIFFLTLFVSNIFLESMWYNIFLYIQIVFLLFAIIGIKFKGSPLGVLGAFLLFNFAIVVALLKILTKNIDVSWAEDRESDKKHVFENTLLTLLILIFTGLLLFVFLKHLSIAEAFFWIFFLLILYTYIGYPSIILILSAFINKDVKKADIEPDVSIIITAYNEEKDIANKLENTLSLNYPKDKLEIIVASDGSTDRTDDIVKEFSDRGVKLIRVEGRVGKTETQNRVVSATKGDIIIFSDAASMYKNDAIRKIVRNFADQKVGGVAGKCQYIKPAAGGSTTLPTRLYWEFDTFIKKCQTRLWTIAGASGLIYSVRKENYIPLPPDIISDMVEPMMIIKQNRRFVYEDEAIAYEQTTSEFKQEFRMRVRVIVRGMTGMIFMRSLLNPMKYGWISIQLFSHKIFRWLSPICLIGLFITNLLLIYNVTYLILFVAQISVCFIAIAIASLKNNKSSVGTIFFYVFVSIFASVAALFQVLIGKKVTVWETERK